VAELREVLERVLQAGPQHDLAVGDRPDARLARRAFVDRERRPDDPDRTERELGGLRSFRGVSFGAQRA
jgi:hypothetical protein